jgi:hypothetical protein
MSNKIFIAKVRSFFEQTSYDSFSINAGQTIRIAGNSTERSNEGIGKRCERLPKRLGGLSAAP